MHLILQTLRKERNMLKSMLNNLEKLSEEDIIVSKHYEKPDDGLSQVLV